EKINGVSQAGAVHILYGSASGLRATGSQFWSQNSSGILDTAETDDFFGDALVAGDFNGDGFADLAIGVDQEDLGGIDDCGAVNVIYGSSQGLRTTGNQLWTQESSGVLDMAEAEDQFASALAAGDFNGDGFDDLAIGVQGENTNKGAVQILWGTANKLRATN